MSEQAFDLISIGGGSGGLACAQRAAEYGAKAPVIEPARLGRDLRERRMRAQEGHVERGGRRPGPADAGDYGFEVTVGDHDWAALKRKRDAYVLRLNGIYERNLAAKGVAYVRGRGAASSMPHTVEVNGAALDRPPRRDRDRRQSAMVRRIPGAELGISSDGFFELERRPQRVAVVGSGYVACELAACVSGARQPGGAVHPQGPLADALRRHAWQVPDARDARPGNDRSTRASYRPRCARKPGSENAGGGGRPRVRRLRLRAVGDRPARPTSPGLNLRAAGVAPTTDGFIATDDFQNTNVAGVYAIGDVTGRAALTPVAIAAGRRLSDRLFGGQARRGAWTTT